MTTTQHIFQDTALAPNIKVTYLPDANMYKVDYGSDEIFATMDVVTNMDGLVASLMLRSAYIMQTNPALTNGAMLASFIMNLRSWTEAITGVKTQDTATEVTSVTKLPELRI